MTGKLIIRTISILIVTIVWAASPLCAQDVAISARVNLQSVPVNGRLVLTVTVSGADAGKASELVLDDMPEFTVYQTGRSQSIEIINFRTSASITYAYTLVPNTAGTYKVGAGEVTVNSKSIRGEPVSVVVTDAATVPPPSQQPQAQAQTTAQPQQGNADIFVTASTDRQTAYVGEQITYTFELFNRTSTSDLEYTPPATTGFWTVDLPSTPQSITVHNNRQYSHNVVKTALFPTTSGELTIGQSSISYTPRLSFFTTGSVQTLNTDPVTVTVRPLPTLGKPDGFSGAVGTFEITAQANRDTVRVGDVVTVRVSVTGQGNLDLISLPGEPDLSAYKTYPPRVADTIHNSGFTVGGIKTWEYMVIPASPGQAVIDSFSLAYFDPARGQYRTVQTEPISLAVLPGTPTSISTQYGIAAVPAGGEPVQDIRYLKPPRESIGVAPQPLHTSWLFWFGHLFSVFGFAGAVWYKIRRDRIESDTGLRRKLLAWKLAQKRLNTAAGYLKSGESAAFCGALHDSVTGYIADMLNTDTGAMTARDIELLLLEKDIPESLAERIRKTLELCDFIRFASIGSENDTHQTVFKNTTDHLNRLRGVL